MRLAFLIAPFAFGALAWAQSPPKAKDPIPQPLYALQLGADPGKTTRLTLRGLNLDAATELRLEEPKSTGKILGKGKKVAVPNPLNAQLVGDSEIEIEVTLPREVPGGEVPLRLAGPGGEGKAIRLLLYDETPRLAEKEPNDGFKQAMVVPVPCLIEGSFRQNQDVDVFRFDARAGEEFRIQVLAARFGVPVDAMLSMHDAEGRTLIHGELPPGSRDPEIRFKAPRDGAYFVSLIEGFDQGGPMFVYRLAFRKVEPARLPR